MFQILRANLVGYILVALYEHESTSQLTGTKVDF